MGTKASRSGDRPSKADDLQNHSLKSRAAAVSIASNATLIVFKLTVGIMSGSIAIISEALHSGSDLVAALIAFWSVRQAPRIRPTSAITTATRRSRTSAASSRRCSSSPPPA